MGGIPRGDNRRVRLLRGSAICIASGEPGRLKPTLRQVHIAGERLFVDFAGHTMEVIDAATGEIHRAEIFVAVLGASSFIYAEATGSQALADWIGAHVNALASLGGAPRQIVSEQPQGRDHQGLAY